MIALTFHYTAERRGTLWYLILGNCIGWQVLDALALAEKDGCFSAIL